MLHKYIVINDCSCERSAHEILRIHRADVKLMELNKKEVVIEVEKFSNVYGSYIRVVKEDRTDSYMYDILPENLTPL